MPVLDSHVDTSARQATGGLRSRKHAPRRLRVRSTRSGKQGRKRAYVRVHGTERDSSGPSCGHPQQPGDPAQDTGRAGGKSEGLPAWPGQGRGLPGAVGSVPPLRLRDTSSQRRTGNQGRQAYLVRRQEAKRKSDRPGSVAGRFQSACICQGGRGELTSALELSARLVFKCLR